MTRPQAGFQRAAHDGRNSNHPRSELSSIAQGAGIVFLGSIIGNSLRYLFQLLVARGLGTELFGLFILGLTVFTVTEIFVELGLPNGVIRYVALFNGQQDRARVKGIILRAMQSVFFWGILVAVGIIILSRPLAMSVFSNSGLIPVLRFFAVILPFSATATIIAFAFQGFKAISYKVYVGELLEPLLRVVSIGILFILGLTLFGVLAAYGLVTILILIISLFLLKKIDSGIFSSNVPAVFETKKLYAFSWPLLLVYFIGYLLTSTDTFMLGFLRTIEEVGVYGAAQRTSYLCSLILTSFTSLFAPVIADLYHRNQQADVKHIFQSVSKWTFMISLPVCLVIMLVSKNIVLVFGQSFSEAAIPLNILAVGWLVHSATGLSGTILTMSGKSKLHLLNFSLLFLLNVILNYLLIPAYGMTGAALATAISLIVVDLITIIQVYWIMKIHPFHPEYLKSLASAGIAAVSILMILRPLFPRQNLLHLGAASLSYLALYSIILFILGINLEDKRVMSEIISRMRGNG